MTLCGFSGVDSQVEFDYAKWSKVCGHSNEDSGLLNITYIIKQENGQTQAVSTKFEEFYCLKCHNNNNKISHQVVVRGRGEIIFGHIS